MLLTQFILQNAHFGLNVFAALVFFAVFWLYFDAWFEVKYKKDLLKITGFLLLSLAFLIHAAYMEQAVIGSALFGSFLVEGFANLLKLTAYILITAGLLLDPIQKKPNQPKTEAVGVFALSSLPNFLLPLLFPLVSFINFLLLRRRATLGLENHLKPLAVGFLLIFFYDLASVYKIFESTNNINIYNLVKPFGPLWLLTHLILFVALVIIAKWVFGYLLKRIQTQLFMIMNILVLSVFLITTVSFTGLLLNNLSSDALSHLNTDVNVVGYAVSAKQAETLSDAEVVSQNASLQAAVLSKDKASLKSLTTSTLLAKRQSYLIVTASSGAVLMRGEDNEKFGDSLSQDSLFVHAKRGEKVSSVTTIDGALAPVVSIRSAVPIISSGQIIGTVIVGTNIDNAFVDGIKKSTKLNVSVYAGNTLSATTFVASDGKSRYVGVKEENANIKKNVLIEGKNYSSEVNVLGIPYFAAFAPLKDVDGNPAGMLFVGKESSSVIQAASASIEYTFLIAVVFLIISVLPSYLISKYITKQFSK